MYKLISRRGHIILVVVLRKGRLQDNYDDQNRPQQQNHDLEADSEMDIVKGETYPKLNRKPTIMTRTLFPETWLWETIPVR